MKKTGLIEKKFREGKISKREYDKMLEHCQHHGLKHLNSMLDYMEFGTKADNFQKAHEFALGDPKK